MPGTMTPPADGTTGDGGTSSASTPLAGVTPPQGGTTPPAGSTDAKTFTQAELDAIIATRLAREKPDPEVLRKAAEFDKLEAANQTELERATKAREAAEQKAKDANARADRILIRAAIMAEAASQNAADTDTVVALLNGSDAVTIDGEDVKGAKEAVAKLLKDKPFLVKVRAPGASGGEFGGNDQTTLDEKIREAEGKKDWDAARRLKLAKAAGR